MRIEKLSGDRIKVTLSSSELINFDIDVSTLTPDSKELHSFLFHVMEAVREETGFNPYNGQVVVEATPSRDGISIIVSKMRPSSRKIKEDIKNGISVQAKIKQNPKYSIFYFGDFDDLCNALCLLRDDELSLGSLYRMNDTYCYVTKNTSKFSRCIAIMSEFASKTSAYPLQLTYIMEHGEKVAESSDLIYMVERLRLII